MKTYKVQVDDDGTKYWYHNDKLHREEWSSCGSSPIGTKKWYLNGNIHRTDGPAVEYADGTKMWFVKWQVSS
jgi:antitoxin component YwqK of YwqJK toxin-antitoxin module